VPLLGGAGSHLTVSIGPRPTSIPSGILVYPAIWPQRTWAENWRAVLLYGRGVGSPSNTMSPSLWRTSVPSRILMHPAVWPQHTGRKLGGAVPLFLGGGAGSPSSTMWPGLRPTSMPSAILIHPFGRNKHGPKIGGCAPFLGRGSWVPI